MHTDMTELAIKWYPELADIITKYDLRIKLDQFGSGKCIYYYGEEIGYFYEIGSGFEIHYVKDYGVDFEVHERWSSSLSESIENNIIKNSDEC